MTTQVAPGAIYTSSVSVLPVLMATYSNGLTKPALLLFTGRRSDNAAKIKYETGLSVATALAAGLAAMIIYCVKASILALKTANQNKGQVVGIAIPDNTAGMIAKHEAMKRAFTCLGEVTPNKFIQVWEKLDKISSMLKSRTGDLTPELKLERTNQFVQFGSRLASSIQSDGIKRRL
ncbi:uncharacterized protein TrAFT101_011245 [Trichoderma asperellum]|uniref:uncharacterized protein n=1 Tax=Trichoderma asperellum TaxID=101201 RepID=UPI00332AFD4F|nr:hypothetical protein TrAFT101_011245 [Trichoderma asperellum]